MSRVCLILFFKYIYLKGFKQEFEALCGLNMDKYVVWGFTKTWEACAGYQYHVGIDQLQQYHAILY